MPDRPSRKAVQVTQGPVWTPTLRWHLRAAAVLLVACTALFFICKAAASLLPQPYQKHTPAAGTTPWLNK